MRDNNSPRIIALPIDWSNGNEIAFERLMSLVCDELRRMARNYMCRQPSGHTFQTTELIHEAYLKIDYARSKSRGIRGGWQNRKHFNKFDE